VREFDSLLKETKHLLVGVCDYYVLCRSVEPIQWKAAILRLTISNLKVLTSEFGDRKAEIRCSLTVLQLQGFGPLHRSRLLQLRVVPLLLWRVSLSYLLLRICTYSRYLLSSFM
jgi:hypothetical protein